MYDKALIIQGFVVSGVLVFYSARIIRLRTFFKVKTKGCPCQNSLFFCVGLIRPGQPAQRAF